MGGEAAAGSTSSGSKVRKSKKSSSSKKRVSSRTNDGYDKKSKAAKGGAATAGSSSKKLLLALGALIVLILFFSKSSGGGEADVPVAEESGKKKKKKSKDSNSGDTDDEDALKVDTADIIESKTGSLGWTPLQGPLVTKRPPRECSIQRIAPQVTTPFFVLNKKTKWERRIYTCIRLNKQECSKPIMADFQARRWKLKASKLPLGERLLSTFVISDSFTLERLRLSKPDAFAELYFMNEGSTYLNALLGASGLDGSLHEQYTIRNSFTKSFGCPYNALKAQMPQFLTDVPSECEKMERLLAKRSSESWFTSTFNEEGGAPVTSVQPGASFKGDFCANQNQVDFIRNSRSLASQLVPNPFKLQGKLFDVRGFILIGSTLPFMTFFHQGYVRLSKSAKSLNSPFQFDEGSEDITLEALQEVLAKDKITGSHYVDTFLKSSMKQIALFAFHAARTKIERRRGSFQLFSVDYVIDDTFRIHMEKTAGNPDLSHLKSFDASGMISDMHDLVQELNEVPVAFESMVKGDKYGQWELIFSELSETCHKILYNPCHLFIDFNDKDLTKQNKKVGKVQATAKRLENEDKRIVKKTEERKKNVCREQKIPYPGTKCNKLLESMEDEEFNRLFKEHEASFNPNDFRLSKPGEVFPHEIV